MCSNTSQACQFYANMRLLHISLTAAFFTYFSKVHISHIFPHKLAFSAAILILFLFLLPSVLLRCWLGDRKGIWPVKKLEWWGTGMVICLERGADLHMVHPLAQTRGGPGPPNRRAKNFFQLKQRDFQASLQLNAVVHVTITQREGDISIRCPTCILVQPI